MLEGLQLTGFIIAKSVGHVFLSKLDFNRARKMRIVGCLFEKSADHTDSNVRVFFVQVVIHAVQKLIRSNTLWRSLLSRNVRIMCDSQILFHALPLIQTDLRIRRIGVVVSGPISVDGWDCVAGIGELSFAAIDGFFNLFKTEPG